MSTPERCREQAREAERLASVVSYERDRVRLLRQADEWRARASELEAVAHGGGDDPADGAVSPRARSPWRRLLAALLHRGGSRGG